MNIINFKDYVISSANYYDSVRYVHVGIFDINNNIIKLNDVIILYGHNKIENYLQNILTEQVHSIAVVVFRRSSNIPQLNDYFKEVVEPILIESKV